MNLKIVTTECKLLQPVWKTARQFLKELKIELPYDSTIPLLDIYPENNENSNSKRYMHARIHSSTIYNSQDIERPKWPSTDNWLKTMWYNEILLDDKKEQNDAIYSNTDGPREYYT